MHFTMWITQQAYAITSEKRPEYGSLEQYVFSSDQKQIDDPTP